MKNNEYNIKEKTQNINKTRVLVDKLAKKSFTKQKPK